MDVLLTFDVEIWCGDWEHLDESFPSAYRRYVYGSSSKGDFGLPHILERLQQHNLKGVFFVEPLFSGRFGIEPLATIVQMLKDAGQEVQLHLHPEWTDEIDPPILRDVSRKRQHLHYYTREEQTTLVRYGLDALQQAGASTVNAFRAGNYAANRDTFAALEANGIEQDSSINATMSDSVPDLREGVELYRASFIDGIREYPVTVLVDGFGRPRHAQIGACSAGELIEAMEHAEISGWREFVVVAHNFELLRPGSVEPDPITVRRFERLCAYLGRRARDLPTQGFRDLRPITPVGGDASLPQTHLGATLRRHSEQALRRMR